MSIGGTRVRLRVSADRRTALLQYDEMRRMARVDKAVVLCSLKDGSFQVLGQGMTLDEIGQALLLASSGLESAAAQRNAVAFETHQEPLVRGIHTMGKPILKTIGTGPGGELVPPPGEGFASCGECNHPKWFALHGADGALSRIACAHCGNEVVNLRIGHVEGHA
jgi:hypothetical protein